MNAYLIILRSPVENIEQRAWIAIQSSTESAVKLAQDTYISTSKEEATQLRESIRKKIESPISILIFGLNHTISAAGFSKELYSWFDRNIMLN